ncbi:MAG: hypothetical protein ACLGHL_04785, partial [Actinomycetota bacterium]
MAMMVCLALIAVLLPSGQAQAIATGRIVFNYGSELYSVMSDGTGVTQLTTGTVSGYAPAYSRDGDKIVFWGVGEIGDPAYGIWMMNADGSGAEQVSREPSSVATNDNEPTFSPDRSQIAFVRPVTGGWDLFVMNSDGTTVTNLTDTFGGAVEDPEWAPTGNKIAFSTGSELHIADASTGTVSLLRDTSVSSQTATAPDWAPDGTAVAFVEGSGTIMTVSPTGSNETVLLNGFGRIHDIAYSPDGTEIAFAGTNTTTNESGLFVLSIASGDVRYLDGVNPPTSLDWGPDGSGGGEPPPDVEPNPDFVAKTGLNTEGLIDEGHLSLAKAIETGQITGERAVAVGLTDLDTALSRGWVSKEEAITCDLIDPAAAINTGLLKPVKIVEGLEEMKPLELITQAGLTAEQLINQDLLTVNKAVETGLLPVGVALDQDILSSQEAITKDLLEPEDAYVSGMIPSSQAQQYADGNNVMTLLIEKTQQLIADVKAGRKSLPQAISEGLMIGQALQANLVTIKGALDQGLIDALTAWRDGFISLDDLLGGGYLTINVAITEGLIDVVTAIKTGRITALKAVRDGLIPVVQAVKAGLLDVLTAVRENVISVATVLQFQIASAEYLIRNGVLDPVTAVRQGYIAVTVAVQKGLLSIGKAITQNLITVSQAINGGFITVFAAIANGYIGVVKAITAGLLKVWDAVTRGLLTCAIAKAANFLPA